MSERRSRARALRWLVLLLSMAGALVFLTSSKRTVAGPPTLLAACPQWMDFDDDTLYWLSQHDDHAVHKAALTDGRIVSLGKECSTSVPGSLALDREALYCIDESWQNIARIDKTTGKKLVLRVGKSLSGPIKLVKGEVYFRYTTPQKQEGLAKLNKDGGPLQTLPVSGPAVSWFDVDDKGVVWLDELGGIWTLPAQDKQPRNIGKMDDCARTARTPAECFLVADAKSVYVAYQPRCGSHDRCPREPVSRIDAMPRTGGVWQRLVGELRMVMNLRIDGDALFFADCIGGTLSQISKKGGARRSIEASGACWAYALSGQEAFFWNGSTKLDWSDCKLQRTNRTAFKEAPADKPKP